MALSCSSLRARTNRLHPACVHRVAVAASAHEMPDMAKVRPETAEAWRQEGWAQREPKIDLEQLPQT